MSMEYGIFQSIIEGNQAEAYKKKKADEKSKEFYANRDRIMDHRADADNNPKSRDDILRNAKATYMAHSMMKKTGRDNFDDFVNAKDATSRHLRRHPELNECTIEFI